MIRPPLRRLGSYRLGPHQFGLQPLLGHSTAVTGVALTTGVIHAVPGADHVTNISLLYLLIVIATAYLFGSAPAILASLLAVLSFDWFFVEPRYTLSANEPAEWLALAIFLITAVVISQLTHNLRLRAEEARQREREAAALSQASWAVLAQVSHQHTLTELLRQIMEVVSCSAAAIIVPRDGEAAQIIVSHEKYPGLLPDFTAGEEQRVVCHTLEQSRTTQPDDTQLGDTQPGVATGQSETSPVMNTTTARDVIYLPLAIEQRILGILYLRLCEPPLLVEEQRVLESLANLAAVALERYRLTQAEARAEVLAEADRLKTALLSMVSHDFRSPLAAIKASVTGLLQDGAPWDAITQRELLSGIDQETDRLTRMVGEILALSRLEAGAWRPQCDHVSLNEVIGVALDGLGAEENKRVYVKTTSLWTDVWLDSVQIVQVLHNLLENALKYSPAGSTVELTARKEHDVIFIEVADRGFGLPPGEEQQIFERFYRGTPWRESSLPGSGIGLAICRGLVEAHGGHLTAENRTGGGALFRVTLPARQASIDMNNGVHDGLAHQGSEHYALTHEATAPTMSMPETETQEPTRTTVPTHG